MYLVINQAILPHSLILVKKETMISFPLKGERANILKIIDQVFKRKKIKNKDVQGIMIFSDSTSFSQTRIIITLANLTGKFLNIPISFLGKKEIKNKNLKQLIKLAKKKLERKIILPSYEKEANITVERRLRRI